MRAIRLCPAPAWVTQLRVERRAFLFAQPYAQHRGEHHGATLCLESGRGDRTRTSAWRNRSVAVLRGLERTSDVMRGKPVADEVPSHHAAVSLMLPIAMLSISLLVTPPIAANAGASCRQEADMAAARTASAVARSSRVVPAEQPDRCRAYSKVFFDAVEARQAASICADDTDRQRTLAMLDAKIDAFNNLIASECGGS
jgi:hypothetical protein